MKPKFEFQRGDTVRIILHDGNKFTEDPGLVLKVTEKEIEVRQDSDASIWTTDLNGRRFSAEGNQYIQLQKVYNPENNYKGQRVTAGLVQVSYKEYKPLHEERIEILPILKVRLYSDNIESPFYEQDFEPEGYGGISGYIDFNKKFSI